MCKKVFIFRYKKKSKYLNGLNGAQHNEWLPGHTSVNSFAIVVCRLLFRISFENLKNA